MSPSPPNRADASAPRSWLELDDARLLEQCAVDVYRASGPGGQKRNKTSSAVRLRHGPSGLIVVATESRSQHENRARALRRLRHAIALTQRNAIDPAADPPEFFARALDRDRTLRVNPRHPDYCLVVQHVLDLFAACEGNLAATAEAIGISTGQLMRFLKNDDKLWAQVSRHRARRGEPGPASE